MGDLLGLNANSLWGFADGLTLNATQLLRQAAGIDGVDANSSDYQNGKFVGTVTGMYLMMTVSSCALSGVASLAYDMLLLSQRFAMSYDMGTNLINGNYGSAALDALGIFGTSAAFMRACFAAGTPIKIEGGSKPVEQIRPGVDRVLSRNEFDPEGPLAYKDVEEVFVRLAPVLNLHVGGRIIGTTAEHPFWVEGRGWTKAIELRIGDVLHSDDGQRITVEGVADSGRVQTVYNFRVAEYHTYFVGGESWDFSVWAHNACVYQSVEKDTVKYFGIADQGATSTLSQRLAAARARTPAATTAVIPGTNGVTALEAQQMEQALIHYYGRQGAGGTLVNINAGLNVSAANTSAGYSLLSKIQYWGTQFLMHSGGSGI